jgi:hypothetical protein
MAVEVKVCECCGHPLPTWEVQLELTRGQRAIYAALHRAGQAGVPFCLLLDRVYSDRADGGPLTATNSMQVQKNKMQPRLAKFGMKIATTKGHDSIWRLEKLSQTERTETANATA